MFCETLIFVLNPYYIYVNIVCMHFVAAINYEIFTMKISQFIP